MRNPVQALDFARRAGFRVALDGADLVLDGPAEPSSDILAALGSNKADIVRLLATERCRHCHGSATIDDPLVECAYGGHWLQLHRRCIAQFMASGEARAPRFMPRDSCDLCGRPGGRMERVAYAGGPLGGVPVHRDCLDTWNDRLELQQ
jgi:hypothetical protein